MSRFSTGSLISDDDENLNILREELEEELHKIDHLERSQNELKIALQACPQDKDFLLAVRENEGILSSKRRRVAELHEVLMRRDAAYRTEPYLAASALAAPIEEREPSIVVDVAHAPTPSLQTSSPSRDTLPATESVLLHSESVNAVASESVLESGGQIRPGLYL